MAKIIKEERWHDPEGLGIPLPQDAVFEGTYEECVKKLADMDHELNNGKDRKYHQSKAIAWDTETFPRVAVTALEVYYPYAIAKEYYRIVQ